MNQTNDYMQAVNAQKQAANPAHSAWVNANAGSGKTKVLIDRVARLLLEGADPAAILCITFTKAAANEMLARLFDRLGAWSVMPEDTLAEELATLQSGQASDYSAPQLRQARALFARALETPGGLRVETIHAFCTRLLKRFPLEAQLPPGFETLEGNVETQLWQGAKETTLAHPDLNKSGAIDRLSLAGGGYGAHAPLDMIRSHYKALLHFYLAHSGDVKAMTAQVKATLNPPEETPEEIIRAAMTDPVLPIAELRAAVALLLECGKKDSQATAEGLTALLAENDPLKRWPLYHAMVHTKTGPFRANLANKGALQNSLIKDLFQTKDGEGREVARIKQLIDVLGRAETYAKNIALIHTMAEMIGQVEGRKTFLGRLSFDDLVDRAGDLLTRHSTSEWVLYKLDGGLSHLLLDEAQDTSPDQWRLVNALVEDFTAGASAFEARLAPDAMTRTQFTVGDHKQSIYSFQGADPDMFLSERVAFKSRPSAPPTPDMQMSFRSVQPILSFVDTVFDGDVHEEAPFSAIPPADADISRHIAFRAGEAGQVELWPLTQKAEIDEPDPWDAPVDSLHESSPKAQLAAKLAKHIQTLLAENTPVWTKENGTRITRALRPEDIMILVTQRKGGLFDAIIHALKALNLPVAGADRLYLDTFLGVQDVLNIIRFVLQPEDDLVLAEIIRGPFGNLPDDDNALFPLAYGRGKQSLWSRLEQSTDPKFSPLREFLNAAMTQRHRAAFSFVSWIMNSQNGWEKLLARFGNPARDPLQAFVDEALGYDKLAPASLQRFLLEFESKEIELKREMSEPTNEIRVMTVYGSKGLQAPLVILPDTTRAPKTKTGDVLVLDGVPIWSKASDGESDTLAAKRELLKQKQLAEHRRLLYVALTRAEDRLIICGAAAGKPKTGYDKKSWYGLCLGAMDRLAIEEDADGIYTFGDAPPPVTATAHSKAENTTPTPPAWLFAKPKPVTGRIRTLAPTALVASDMPVIAPFSSLDTGVDRFLRGRLIHNLLQILPEMPEEQRAEKAAHFLLSHVELDAAARKDITDAAIGTLNAKELHPLFSAGSRAEAPIIGGAPELPDGVVISGRVDRLIMTKNDILIVDYKSNRPPPLRVEDVPDSSMAQMAAYWAVMRHNWPGKSVRCALIFTDGPRIMPLPEEMMLDSLIGARKRFGNSQLATT